MEGIDELLKDKQTLFLRQTFLFSEPTLKCASIAKLVDKVEIVGCFEHVYVLDDVFVLLDVCQDVDLIHSALFKLLVFFESAHLNDLHRVLLVVIFVDGSIDLAIGSLPNDFVKSVVLNDAYHIYIPSLTATPGLNHLYNTHHHT